MSGPIRVMVQAQVDIRGVLRFLRGGRRDAFWKEQEEKEMKK
jgi:hypothetical protein